MGWKENRRLTRDVMVEVQGMVRNSTNPLGFQTERGEGRADGVQQIWKFLRNV